MLFKRPHVQEPALPVSGPEREVFVTSDSNISLFFLAEV